MNTENLFPVPISASRPWSAEPAPKIVFLCTTLVVHSRLLRNRTCFVVYIDNGITWDYYSCIQAEQTKLSTVFAQLFDTDKIQGLEVLHYAHGPVTVKAKLVLVSLPTYCHSAPLQKSMKLGWNEVCDEAMVT